MATKRRDDDEKGYSLFWREAKQRWVFSAPDPVTRAWKQQTIPGELGLRERDRGKAVAFVLSTLAGQGVPTGPAAVAAKKRSVGPTVADIAPRWIELRAAAVKEGRIKPATLSDNEVHLRKYVLPTLGARVVSEVTDDIAAIRSWVRDVRKAVSPVRCRNIASTLRTMFDDAKAENWVKFGENPLRLEPVIRELPDLPKNRRPITVPTAHAQALIDCDLVPLDRRARYVVALTAGFADGEIAGLTWGAADLDAEIPTIAVRQAVLLVGDIERVDDKGEPAGDEPRRMLKTKRGPKAGAPKNDYRLRTIPLHPAAVAALRAWKDGGVEVLLGHRPRATDPIFPGANGKFTRPRSAELIREDLATALLPRGREATDEERAVVEALTKDITFHATRRTFLSWLAEADVSEELRKRLAGHSQPSVTEAHYTARELAQLAAAVATIPLHWTLGALVSPPDATVSVVVSRDTTRSAKGAELWAPPAGIEPATNGLGNRTEAGPHCVRTSARAAEKADASASRNGGEGRSGYPEAVSAGVDTVTREGRTVSQGSRALAPPDPPPCVFAPVVEALDAAERRDESAAHRALRKVNAALGDPYGLDAGQGDGRVSDRGAS